MTREVSETVLLTFATGDTLEGTRIHPIWSPARAAWVPMGEWAVGDTVLGRDGEIAVVEIQFRNRSVPVYNLEVHGEHVYEVTAAEILVHNACPDIPAPNSGKLVFDAATKSWTSPGGLVFGQGSVHGNRVNHALDHLVSNPNKPTHAIFNVVRTKLIGLIDEAWAKKGGPLPNDPGAYVIDMGRVIGTAGQTKIKIVARPGTNEIITAYPVF